MPETAFGFGTPFDAQIAYLRAKLALPTERWGQIAAAAHDRAFAVAGAAKADLVADLQAAMVQRATDGLGLEAFRRDFRAIVAKHGWTGWTGEGSADGEAWRTRTIYQANMAASYAAGRRQQMLEPGYVRLRPFWRYLHSDNVMHPRPHHLAWHGITLRHDHPWWKTHYAPNGFGCECRIVAVSAREGEASAQAGLGEPPEGWEQIDPKTGAPVGIDKGFDHAPGAAADWPLQRFIDDKLLALDAPIGAAMWQELRPALEAERLQRWRAMVEGTAGAMRAGGETVQVHTVAPETVGALEARGVALENAAVWMRDTELLHALRDTKATRGAGLPVEVWLELPRLLQTAEAYLDTNDLALIYSVDLGERWGKLVVRVNRNMKGRFNGVRAHLVSNFVQTGGLVNPDNLLSEPHMVPLKRE
jgi:hypothetical protein